MQTFITIEQNEIKCITSEDRINIISVYLCSRDYYNCKPLYRTSVKNANEIQLEAMADKLANQHKAIAIEDHRSYGQRFRDLSASYKHD